MALLKCWTKVLHLLCESKGFLIGFLSMSHSFAKGLTEYEVQL